MLHPETGREPSVDDFQNTLILDPVQHLVDCHEGIEQRLKILEGLIVDLRSGSESKRSDARESLAVTLDFLETIGALHTEDEEGSVFPRLLVNAGSQDPTLAELTTMLEEQHREKETTLRKLLDCVAAFPAAPDPPSEHQTRVFTGLAAQIGDLYRPHIMVENQRLIPLLAEYLTSDDLDRIREEMLLRWKRS